MSDSNKPFSSQSLIALIVIVAVLVIGWLIYQKGSPANGPIDVAEGGWKTTVAAALADNASGPRLVVISRAGWSRYEKNTFEHEEIARLIDPLSRARIDFTSDTPHMTEWGIEGAPAIALVTADGKLITRLLGAKDISIIRKTIERSMEFPLPVAELSARTDVPAIIRSIEVNIEMMDFETAALRAKQFCTEDTSADFARGQYLYAYAVAENGNQAEALKWSKTYLERYPNGPDRSAVQWLMIVFDIQAGKDRQAAERINEVLAKDSGSPFARQAALAYSIQYLAQAKRKLAEADAFLTKFIAESTPWTDDFLMARSTIRMTNLETIEAGIEDLRTIAVRGGSLSEDAIERLSLLPGASPAGEALMPQIILILQDLVRAPSDRGAARFHLARLYMLSDNLDRAKEEAQTLIVGGGDYADEALLLSGLILMELEKTPAAAVEKFTEAIKKYPDRETYWAAKYGLARALFFAGRMAEARTAVKDVIDYVAGRRYLPEAFLHVMPQPMPPRDVEAQFRDFLKKLDDLAKEPKGAEAFQLLLEGVLASSKGDTVTASGIFARVTSDYAASSIADDAWFEVAKMEMRDGNAEAAMKALEKIATLYKESDNYEVAVRFLEALKQQPQQRR